MQYDKQYVCNSKSYKIQMESIFYVIFLTPLKLIDPTIYISTSSCQILKVL